MIKATYTKRDLIFKRPAGTSRGVLLTKPSYFLFLYNEKEPEKKGVGEISILPNLSIDDVPDFESKLDFFISEINAGKSSEEIDFKQFPAIQMGIETALLDLKNGGNKTIYPSDFVSGKASIPINGLIWMGDEHFMKSQIQEKIECGFKCLKLKIGALNFETEIQILKSIRRSFSSNDLELRVDANGAFQVNEASEKLKRLSELELHSIEQPIKQNQVEKMAKLCENTPLPIALDEELIGINANKKSLLKLIQPQYIILKPSLLGGFKASEEWIEIADNLNIGWWVTSALESNIGLNAIAQWTATLGSEMYQGLGTGALFENNISCPLELNKDNLFYNPTKKWEAISF